jgi:hypothetical protein
MDHSLAVVSPGHTFKTCSLKIHFIAQVGSGSNIYDLYFEDAGVTYCPGLQLSCLSFFMAFIS